LVRICRTGQVIPTLMGLLDPAGVEVSRLVLREVLISDGT
jgi:hypothetical protein